MIPAVFLAIAVSIHNIPTGIAIGSSMVNHSGITLSLMIAVALHSVPEGMTIVFPLVMAGYSLTGYFFLAGGISLFLGAGSWLGITIGDRTFHLNTLLMGGAIGAIGYVALHEVLGKVKPKLPAVEFLFAGSAGAFFVFVFYLLAG